MVFQGHGVQVQRAVAGQFFAEVRDQRVLGRQRHMGGLAWAQLHHVIVLLHLQEVAVIGPTQQQALRRVEDFFHALGNELRTVVTEAAHPQPWQVVRRQLVEVVTQAVEQCVGAVVAADHHLVPAVERHLVQGQHQIVAHAGVAQGVGTLGGHHDIQVAVMLERVNADVDQQQHVFRHGRAQQAIFIDAGQRQGDGLLQAAQQVEQLEFGHVTDARVQCQARAAVDHAVAVAPGEHFQQVAAAFDRRKVLPFQCRQVAVVQAPVVLAGLLAVGRLHQGQGVFGQVRGDAGVDELDLAGLALKRRIQAPAQHIEVALVNQADSLLGASELGEKAVAVIQLIDQRAAFGGDLAHFPLAATVQQGQLALVPAPFMGQAFQ